MTNGFAGKSGLSGLMKQAQDMQKKMQDVQKEISAMVIKGQAGGSLVMIEMTGDHRANRVTLDPSVLKEDKTLLEDLLATAINDATDKIDKATRQKMTAVTGMKLPDGFNLPTG